MLRWKISSRNFYQILTDFVNVSSTKCLYFLIAIHKNSRLCYCKYFRVRDLVISDLRSLIRLLAMSRGVLPAAITRLINILVSMKRVEVVQRS